jgi:tRNA A37 threonylcarbamoyltransferase TsaD
MAKKRFTGDFTDSLFDESLTQEAAAMPVSSSRAATEIPTSVVLPRRASKNFTSDLDSLFQEAFTEAVEEKLDKLKRDSGLQDPFAADERAYKKPLSGLDALIRQTVDSSLAALDHAAVKRLTIMFENQKIEKLKTIAKQERSFVKDLVSGVLSEFIDNYERKLLSR